MADEVKKEEVVEEVTETSEASTESTEEKGKKKAKKEKSSVDVNAIMNNVKGGINAGSEKVSNVVKEADNKKRMAIFFAIIALEVVLSLLGGVNPFMLIVQIVVAIVGFIGLRAAFPADSEEDTTEE